MMPDLFQVLEQIKAAPGMYLGRPAVTDLFMFLNGYEFARSQAGVEFTPGEERFYEVFQPWLQQRLGVTSVTSWAKLIMLSCHDEQAGFERFFQLLNEFQQQVDATVVATH
jgi:hypothetical protein